MNNVFVQIFLLVSIKNTEPCSIIWLLGKGSLYRKANTTSPSWKSLLNSVWTLWSERTQAYKWSCSLQPLVCLCWQPHMTVKLYSVPRHWCSLCDVICAHQNSLHLISYYISLDNDTWLQSFWSLCVLSPMASLITNDSSLPHLTKTADPRVLATPRKWVVILISVLTLCR